MARCTFTWENHGDTLQCEVEGEHRQFPGDSGGTVDWHVATLLNETDGDDYGKPYEVGFCDPSLA